MKSAPHVKTFGQLKAWPDREAGYVRAAPIDNDSGQNFNLIRAVERKMFDARYTEYGEIFRNFPLVFH